MTYEWPGNVRELERVIERAVALAGSEFLEPDDLPPALLGGYADVLLPSLRSKESMRAWGSRYARLGARTMREQQAPRLPRAWNLVSHIECVPAFPSGVDAEPEPPPASESLGTLDR